MSLPLPLNEEQRDCLQEITNVAIGAAAESLADFTGHFVHLPIPHIRCTNPTELLTRLTPCERLNTANQCFRFRHCQGYALMVMDDDSLTDLARLTTRPLTEEQDAIQLLHDLCKTTSETCLSRFGEMLEDTATINAPIIEHLHSPLPAITIDTIATSHQLLSVDIHYQIEHTSCNCHLLLLFLEDALDGLKTTLNKLIDL